MKNIITLLCLMLSIVLSAQNTINIHSNNEIIYSESTSNIDSLKPLSGNLQIYLNDRFSKPSFAFIGIDSITFSTENIEATNDVYIKFNDSSVEINNPLTANGINITTDGTSVEILSSGGLTNVHYHISGACNEAEIVFKSDTDFFVDLENATLALTKGSIIANKEDVEMTINIPTNTQSQLNGATKAAINSDGVVTIIGRGNLGITSSASDYKAIKSDANINLLGSNIAFNISGDQSKAISSKKSITIDGSILDMQLSGNAVLEEDSLGFDPSYCTGVKADANLYFYSGQLTINHTGDGGKGISVDGDIFFEGGITNITTSGGGDVYQDAENATDSYTATAIKADGEIYFNKGIITCSSTGKAGKGISADNNIYIGKEGASNSDLQLTVSTSGERFYVSGSGEDADYANPKAIKSDADVTVNSGTITINCTQSTEGGEGLESKNVMTINGGELYIYSKKDDAVNAKKSIVVNGGRVYARSDGNDGTDSNGTFTINQGLYISAGSNVPEGGIDCDQNKFTVNGGTLIGTGGSSSYPNAGTQHTIIYSATAGEAICLKDADGNILFCYQLPELPNSGGMGWAPPGDGFGGGPGGGFGGSDMTLLITHPAITQSSTYTLISGGTISGGTEFNNYYTNAQYTGGTSKTITTSKNYYTTVK